MTETKNYKLKKPDPTDFYNVADFNGNADLVDAALAKKTDMPASVKAGDFVAFTTSGIKDSGKKPTDFLSSTTKPEDIGAATAEAVTTVADNLRSHANNMTKHLTSAEKSKLEKMLTTDDVVVSSTQPAVKEGRIWIKI